MPDFTRDPWLTCQGEGRAPIRVGEGRAGAGCFASLDDRDGAQRNTEVFGADVHTVLRHS